jgi:membrane associated rhomboid family serine protease
MDLTDCQRALRAVHPMQWRSDTYRKWIGIGHSPVNSEIFLNPSENCHLRVIGGADESRDNARIAIPSEMRVRARWLIALRPAVSVRLSAGMGIYDRDYYRQSLPRGGFGYFSAWSVTTWLIIINVAVFFLDGMLRRSYGPAPFHPMYEDSLAQAFRGAWGRAMDFQMGPLQRWGYFSTATAIYSAQVWRFITFQFLHGSPGHLIGNLVGMFFFGPIVEAHFGARRYLAFYLSCGLAGAVAYLLLGAAHVLVVDRNAPLVGASAGVFGLLVAAAMIAPHVQIFYYVFPVTVGMLAICGMLMAAYAVLASGMNAGGEAAHLGGGILGFMQMKNQHWLNPFAPPRQLLTTTRRRPKRALQKDWSKDFNR